ncbi:MAG TPA: hypothetical protein VEB22_07015 [Phycisphaerales bacterium]|nr:hypothetical protein [Phycisphaerales bacterium]
MKKLQLKPGISLFACAACALGLLLWARLLLVSHPPRVATADPVPQAPQTPRPKAPVDPAPAPDKHAEADAAEPAEQAP